MHRLGKTFLFVCLILSQFFSQKVASQDVLGQWKEYLTNDLGSGDYMYDCEGNCAIVTKKYAQAILLFDVKKAEWLRIDLNQTKTIYLIEAKDNLVWIYGKKFLFAYSSELGVFDSTSIEGEVLRESSTSIFRSYGSSNKLAFFVSDQKFYVFDAEIGQWVHYDYGKISDLGLATFYCKDDYVVVTQQNTDVSHIKNTVYSRITKSFNELDPGVQIACDLTFGFGGWSGETTDVYQVVGYSAMDNQFDSIEQSGYSVEWGYPNDDMGDSLFVFGVAFNKTDSDTRTSYLKFYAYNTMTGNWALFEQEYNIDLYKVGNTLWASNLFLLNKGQFRYSDTSQEWFKYLNIYSSVKESFQSFTTDLKGYDSNEFYLLYGNILIIGDGRKIMAYNTLTGLQNVLDFYLDVRKEYGGGRDYAYFYGYNSGSTTGEFYIYHGPNNHWHKLSFDKPDWVADLPSKNLMIANLSPQNKVLIYDAAIDEIFEFDLPANNSVMIKIAGNLALASTENMTILYNAKLMQNYQKDFKVQDKSLGTGSLIAYDENNKKIFGYSARLNDWHEFTIDEEPFVIYDKGNIGLISIQYGGDYYHRYYAYNSFSGDLIELQPEGRHVWYALGKNTAVVIRTDRVYAFDPQTATNIEQSKDAQLPDTPKLYQNFPNPFNAETQIVFELPHASKIKLELYDLLGQRVKLLKSGHVEAGKHKLRVHLPNLASGVYFYRLKTENITLTRKCLYIK